MASVTPTQFGQGGISTGTGTLVGTVKTGATGIIKCIDVVNTSVGSVNISVYLVPLAGTVGVTNAIVFTQALASYARFQWTGTQVLPSGGFIQAIASATGCTITASGGLYVS